MSEPIWVCSKWNMEPKDEEKWEVLEELRDGWRISLPVGLAMGLSTWVPKSDYTPCPAPEQWEEVAVKLIYRDDNTACLACHATHGVVARATFEPGYRVKSLVVERKVARLKWRIAVDEDSHL